MPEHRAFPIGTPYRREWYLAGMAALTVALVSGLYGLRDRRFAVAEPLPGGQRRCC